MIHIYIRYRNLHLKCRIKGNHKNIHERNVKCYVYKSTVEVQNVSTNLSVIPKHAFL